MSLNPPPLNQNETSLQPFNLLPDELLLSVFQLFDPIKRSLLLPTCRKWHDFLLSHHSLWNVLVLSAQWSFEESLSILKLFNSRSGHQLKHVILGVQARNLDQMERMFEELKRSGKSLKVLGLCHEERKGLGKKMRVLARDLLPSLNTIAGSYHSDDFSSWNSGIWLDRKELKVRDEDEGIKFCQLDEFGSFDTQDRKWLSTAKYIRLAKIRSMKGLYSILKAARSSLVDLDLLGIYTKNFLDDTATLSKMSGTLEMVDLVELGIPVSPELSAALRRWITVRDASRLFLKGEIDSLIGFNMEGVKKVQVILYMYTEFDILAKISVLIDLFLKQNESVAVEELILDCEEGNVLYLNLFLEKLLISSPIPSGHDSIILPNLIKLVIRDTQKLDVELVEKVIESRRSVAPKFNFVCETRDEDEGTVEIEDWAERDWTE